MIRKFKEVFNEFDRAENELIYLMNKSVGKKFKYIDKEGVLCIIEIKYFRDFHKIGVNQVFDECESVEDEFDIADLYEVIKNSVEVE